MRVALALVGVLGCSTHPNPDFCPAHPDQCDGGGAGCATNADCSGVTPTCDVPVATCVAAKTDADCDSQAVLPDGSCAAESDVIYASATAGGIDCSKAAPCPLATAFDQLATKRLLHVAAGRYASNVPIALPNPGRNYVVFGPGAFEQTLAAATGVDVELDFLEITGAPIGLSCANAKVTGTELWIHDNTGYGVQGAPCNLTLARSTIAHNGDGGLLVNQGVIDVANNLFVQNGAANNDNAIAVLLQSATGRLSFNTIAYNHQGRNANHPAGVHCASAAATITGNLISANDRNGSFQTQADGSGCDFSSSYTSVGSANNDLAFNAIDGAPGSFRLTVQSSAVIDVPGLSCSGRDIDNQPRPAGASCDDGADEFSTAVD